MVVDGGAQGVVREKTIPEEFGEEDGTVDEGKTEEEGGGPGGRFEF